MRLAWRITAEASATDLRVLLVLQPLVAIGAVLVPLIIRELVAQILAGDGAIAESVLMLLAANIALGATGVGISYRQQLLSERVAEHAAREIAIAAARVDLVTVETPKFQDELQRARVSASTRPVQLVSSLIGLARGVFAIAGSAFVLWLLQPVLLAVAIAAQAFPLAIALTRAEGIHALASRTTEIDRRRNYALGILSIREFAGEVRAYGLLSYFSELVDRLAAERLHEVSAESRRRVPGALLSSVAASVGAAVSLLLVALLAGARQIGLPQAAGALYAMLQLRGQLNGLSAAITQLYESGLFLEDAESFLSPVPAAAPSPTSQLADLEALTVKDLWFRYKRDASSGVPVAPRDWTLRDVSLEIRAGQIFAIVGENGSGKTTLTKLLTGLYEPQRGSIEWNGQDYRQVDRQALWSKTGFMFQDFARYYLSLRDNVTLGDWPRADDIERFHTAARKSGVEQVMSKLPNGDKTVLGPLFAGGTDLSRGEWQRLALARVFFRAPGILILDEPTAALDPVAERALVDSLRDLAPPMTIVIISQRLAAVSMADYISVLGNGQVVEMGTHEELLARQGLYFDLWHAQQYGTDSLRLSKRESDVLALASDGLPDKEIAARLQIALPTVRTIFQRLYRRHAYRNRAHAVATWARASAGALERR